MLRRSKMFAFAHACCTLDDIDDSA